MKLKKGLEETRKERIRLKNDTDRMKHKRFGRNKKNRMKEEKYHMKQGKRTEG